MPINTVSNVGQEQIKLLREQQAKDLRLVVSMKDACTMLACKSTYLRGLIDDRILATTLDGQRRLVLVSSIYDRLVANIARAHPADGGAAKLHVFRGKRPHELKGKGRAIA